MRSPANRKLPICLLILCHCSDRYAKALIQEEETRGRALRDGLDAAGFRDPNDDKFRVRSVKESSVDPSEIREVAHEEWAENHRSCSAALQIMAASHGSSKLREETAVLKLVIPGVFFFVSPQSFEKLIYLVVSNPSENMHTGLVEDTIDYRCADDRILMSPRVVTVPNQNNFSNSETRVNAVRSGSILHLYLYQLNITSL
jgi:hypothetical protein